MLQNAMKFLLSILVFCIFFSSFATVAEAYCKVDCSHKQTESQASNLSHCADNQKNIDAEKSSNGKSSKSICLECSHCCSSHAINLQSYSVGFYVQPSSIPLPAENLGVGDYQFSLLRPPKTLV